MFSTVKLVKAVAPWVAGPVIVAWGYTGAFLASRYIDIRGSESSDDIVLTTPTLHWFDNSMEMTVVALLLVLIGSAIVLQHGWRWWLIMVGGCTFSILTCQLTVWAIQRELTLKHIDFTLQGTKQPLLDSFPVLLCGFFVITVGAAIVLRIILMIIDFLIVEWNHPHFIPKEQT